MSETQRALRGLIDDLLREPDVVGAAIVSRDGIAVLDAFKRPVHRDTFSAMSATLMGAAEVAFAEARGGPPLRIVAEAHDLKLVISSAAGGHVVVVLAEARADVARVVARIAGAEPPVQGIAKHR